MLLQVPWHSWPCNYRMQDLKTQVEDLVRNRYLDEFIEGTFLMVASTCEGE